jgi:hypothetical protein
LRRGRFRAIVWAIEVIPASRGTVGLIDFASVEPRTQTKMGADDPRAKANIPPLFESGGF